MARIILVSGRGGAGKTTVAAATGLAASRRGVRTLVLSFDLSRSLSGSFGLEQPLFSGAGALPVRVNEHLDLEELDILEALRQGWGDGRGCLAALMGGGLEDVTAEEVALSAGMAELVTLLRLSEHLREQRYELIILDGPSTGEALRFVNGASAMLWHARRQQAPEHAGRRARRMAGGSHASASLEAQERLKAVDELLRDPEVTTLRLVTTADKASIQEAQRAYTYFCLQGVTTDCVVINRLAPEGEGGASEQARAQRPHLEKLRGLFERLPVVEVPLRSGEVVGEDQLDGLSGLLYQGEDPVRLMVSRPVLGFHKEAVEVYRLEIQLPFVARNEMELSRRGEEFVIQVGAMRRNILLPRMVALLPTLGARLEGDRLIVSFRKE